MSHEKTLSPYQQTEADERRRFDFPLSTVLAYEAGQEDGRRLSERERAALAALKAWRAAEKVADFAREGMLRTFGPVSVEVSVAAHNEVGVRLAAVRAAVDALEDEA